MCQYQKGKKCSGIYAKEEKCDSSHTQILMTHQADAWPVSSSELDIIIA